MLEVHTWEPNANSGKPLFCQAPRRAGGRLAADLADIAWLAGDRFTLADIAVYPHLAQFAAPPGATGEWLALAAERPSARALADDLFPLPVIGLEHGRRGSIRARRGERSKRR